MKANLMIYIHNLLLFLIYYIVFAFHFNLCNIYVKQMFAKIHIEHIVDMVDIKFQSFLGYYLNDVDMK